MGLRITKPLSETFSVGFQLVNGWNNVEDNNTGKTIGLNAAWTPKNKKASLLFNSYMGPEKNGPSMGAPITRIITRVGAESTTSC